MTSRFEGVTALVTGAGRGIGAAVALQLADEGAAVGVLDVDPAAVDATVRTIGFVHGRAHAVAGDVTDASSVRAAFDEVEARLGLVTVLVSNAGGGHHAPFLDTPDDEWRRLFDLNVLGTVHVGREAARRLIDAASEGVIVNVASITAHIGNVGQAAYAASKAAVIGLTRVMAVELAPHGIRVNAISSGPVDTELAASLLTPTTRAEREARIPLGRFASVREIATAIAFLACRDAAFVVGETLVADGGFVVKGGG